MPIDASRAKIGLVILAHEDIEQLRRLFVATSGVPRIVHLDKNSSLSASEVRILAESHGVHFSSRRWRTYWASFNIVRAMICSAAELVGREGTVAKVVFLSGTCFPLIPIESIERMLLARPDEVLASRFILTDRGTPMMSMDRIAKRHWFGGWVGFIRTNVSYSAGEAVRRILVALSPRRTALPGYRYACGSQWMVLPRDLVLDLKSAYRAGWFDVFSNSFAPDESAIQTYISSTHWSTLCGEPLGVTPDNVAEVANVHWIRKSMRGYLSAQEVVEASRSSEMFVRKVSAAVDIEASDTADALLGEAGKVSDG